MSQFHFKNFNPDETLKSKANIVLSRILDMSPYGSTATALLEKEECGYRCSLDIFSLHGPIAASVVYSNPLEAISLIEMRVTDLISNWKERRFSADKTYPPAFPSLTDENKKPSLIQKRSKNFNNNKEDHYHAHEKSNDEFTHAVGA